MIMPPLRKEKGIISQLDPEAEYTVRMQSSHITCYSPSGYGAGSTARLKVCNFPQLSAMRSFEVVFFRDEFRAGVPA